MESLEELKKLLCELGFNDTVVLDDPSYITAIEGLDGDGRLIYSYEKMVQYLMETDGCSYEEAVEFIDYNTVRALPYMGDMKPIIIYSLPL